MTIPMFAILICNFVFVFSSPPCPGSAISILTSSVTPFPHVQRQQTESTLSRCNEVTGIWAPCICSLELCIGWYPCGLKYCKGKGDSNSINNNQINSSYRCGIKTCRKCHNFSYYVRQKQQCLWDEWPRKHPKAGIHHRQKASKSVLNRYFHKIFDFNLL